MSEELCNGAIDYAGDPYNVDDDKYYCLVCGATGADDRRVVGGKEHRKGVGGYERAVIEAATAYRAAHSRFTQSQHGHLWVNQDNTPFDAYVKAHNELLATVDRLLQERDKK